MGTDLTRV
jgi:RNA-binding protein 25